MEVRIDAVVKSDKGYLVVGWGSEPHSWTKEKGKATHFYNPEYLDEILAKLGVATRVVKA